MVGGLDMIRAAHAEELPEFARQWARSLLPETRPVDDLGPFVQLGPKRGHGVHRKFLLHALMDSCAEAFALDDEWSLRCDVLEQDGVPLAWALWSAPYAEQPLVIRFLHVVDLARRRGLGSKLLRFVLDSRDSRAPRLTCITSSGAALYRAVAAPALTNGEHAQRIEPRVVEARGI